MQNYVLGSIIQYKFMYQVALFNTNLWIRQHYSIQIYGLGSIIQYKFMEVQVYPNLIQLYELGSIIQYKFMEVPY